MAYNYKNTIETTKKVAIGTKTILVGTFKFLTNKHTLIIAGTAYAVIITTIFLDNFSLRNPVIITLRSPIEAKPIDYISPLGGITEEANAKGNITEDDFETDVTVLNTFIGKASYYSKDGCVGCNPKQIMANGEVFNEDDYTLAFNKLPLNTLVRVTNTETGARSVARVTDRGGFEKYGRIADLSKALAMEIGLETDQTVIRIDELPVNTGDE